MTFKTTNPNLIYADLSFKINGCAFKVHNVLKGGQLEKTYQKAMAVELKNAGLSVLDQKRISITYAGALVGLNVPDFLIDEKVVIDLKRRGRFYPDDFEQTRRYLVALKMKLALLMHFGKDHVFIKRVVNLDKEDGRI